MKQMKAGRLPARIAIFLLALIVALPADPSSAMAQERRERRSLLEILFGPSRQKSDERMQRTPRNRGEVRRNRSTTRTTPAQRRRTAARPAQRAAGAGAAAAAREAAPAPVAKLENAKKVLVIGDFLATGLGEELETAFAGSPGVVVTARSDGSSGLVRDDHFDWPGRLPAIIDETGPAMVVVMLGTNDRQQMRVGNVTEKFPATAWLKEYEARVTRLASTVSERKLPLVWVGLPAFRPPSMTAGSITLNTLYRSQSEKAGGEFVDIWEGFVDEDGKFIVTGSDVNGQQVRLRGTDGITMTRAGKRKLAFYVEKHIRRHLGEMASPELARLDAGQLPLSETATPTPGEDTTAQPIALFDPARDGATELLGAVPLVQAASESPRELLVKRGELQNIPSGRVDDYANPPRQ